MRKEIITCDRCPEKVELELSYIASGKDLCAGHYRGYKRLSEWFDKEMEKWLNGEENELPV